MKRMTASCFEEVVERSWNAAVAAVVVVAVVAVVVIVVVVVVVVVKVVVDDVDSKMLDYYESDVHFD